MKKKLTLYIEEIAIIYCRKHKVNISQLLESIIFAKMLKEQQAL